MDRWNGQLATLRGLTTLMLAVLCWVVAGFALTDDDLSPGAFLGGAKALFVLLAILMTLIATYRLWRLNGVRD